MNNKMSRLLLALPLLMPLTAFAVDPFSMPAINLSSNPDGSQTYSVTLQVLALMTLLTLLPALQLAS